VLSPEDRLSRVEERITDYLQKGVPYVWALDPARKEAFAATAKEGFCETKSGVLATEDPTLEMPLSEVFA
jgi:Uma2 family endonuclease